MTYLADISHLLGQSLDVESTIHLIPQVVVPRLGQWCAIHLSDPAGKITLAALTHTDENAIPELRAALDPRGGLSHALRTQLRQQATMASPIWFHHPTHGAAVPLLGARRQLGILSAGRPADRAHTAEDITLLTDIARRAGTAIDNAIRSAHHHATSQALQKALLPRALPAADGIEFAADYLPATTGDDIGGDFYDVTTLRPGQWLAAIGDVCGKGPPAAARTGQIRDVLRVLTREGHPLISALTLLNDVMIDGAEPRQFCTLAAAHLQIAGPGQPPGLRCDLVLAGHEQPILIRANGTTELIGEHGTALGLINQLHLTATTHHLAPGDTLLAYTDGVTERRGPHGLYGTHRLLTAATPATTARDLITAVRASLEAYSEDPRTDDIALLAIHIPTPPHPTSTTSTRAVTSAADETSHATPHAQLLTRTSTDENLT
ncbi:MAG TPA: GAF domain-containing SpoIIE family protein phosphatase, partial [Pseudonocardiaceae bacterium]|nr:GAF domain-containing SpoIIE family protein phosphatase [Pseudonocardiaceae bacterium]